jgi:hypothetical protein
MPTVFQVLQVETLRRLALEILRAAVTAANAVGAPPSPLKDLYIPAHRFEKLDPKRAPFLHVVARSDGGAGDSRELPYIESVAALHFNLFCACGRDEAADLDAQAAVLTDAIVRQVLEDPEFLKVPDKVNALRITFDDGVVRGESHGGEYDCLLVQVELECEVGPVQFEPRLPDDADDLAAVNATAELGDGLLVKAQIPTT